MMRRAMWPLKRSEYLSRSACLRGLAPWRCVHAGPAQAWSCLCSSWSLRGCGAGGAPLREPKARHVVRGDQRVKARREAPVHERPAERVGAKAVQQAQREARRLCTWARAPMQSAAPAVKPALATPRLCHIVPTLGDAQQTMACRTASADNTARSRPQRLAPPGRASCRLHCCAAVQPRRCWPCSTATLCGRAPVPGLAGGACAAL